MKVDRARLCNDDGTRVPYVPSPNCGGGPMHAPRAIVVHYTAGRSFHSSISTLTNPHRKASAHLIVGREGNVVQLVRFDDRAWHAGDSSWTFADGTRVDGVNGWAIGIELENFGRLEQPGDELDRSAPFFPWWDRPRRHPLLVERDEVLIATHKHQRALAGWQPFTKPQLGTLLDCCRALRSAYSSIEDVIGHDDVAPERKQDPGPAFPMDEFRGLLFGAPVPGSGTAGGWPSNAATPVRARMDDDRETDPSYPPAHAEVPGPPVRRWPWPIGRRGRS